MKKTLWSLLLMLLPMAANAQLGTVEINGIYYELGWADDGQGHVINAATVKANPNKYVGDVIIPATVNYEKSTYTVTSIDGSAFKGCEGLTSLSIPNSVTMTNIYHFEGCSSLTTVNIPNSVTYIGVRAFWGCSSLTSIVIPNSVTVIQADAFYGCSSLMYLSVESGNPTYDSRGNCNAIIETSTNELILGCKNTVIPNTVTSIGACAFLDNTVLTSLTIPATVENVGRWAFDGCTNLASLTIEGETTFADSAPFGYFKSSTELASPIKILTLNCAKVTNMFEGCKTLTTLNLGDDVREIAEYAFYDCSSLKSVTISSGVKTVGNYAFKECTSLESLTIEGETTFGEYAFADCTYLETVTIEGETTFGDNVFGVFYNGYETPCPIKTLTINCATVTDMLSGCKTLTTLNLGDDVREIAEHAFSECVSLKSLTIPSGVETVGNYAFKECTSLESVTIEGETKFADNAFGYFYNGHKTPCPIKSLTINSNIDNSGRLFNDIKTLTTVNYGKNVMGDKFEDICIHNNNIVSIGIDCEIVGRGLGEVSSNVQTIHIGENVMVIETGAFPWESLETLTCAADDVIVMVNAVNENSIWYRQQNDGIVYIGNTAYKYKGDVPEDMSLAFDERTIGISDLFLSDWMMHLKEVIIPKNVKYIGADAFHRCDGLTSYSVDEHNVYFCDIDGVLFNKAGTELLSYPGCRAAKSYIIPNGVTIIGPAAFGNYCWNLTSISIPEGVKTIGDRAFDGCGGLSKIVLPSSVTRIGNMFWSGVEGMRLISYIVNPAEVEIVLPDEEEWIEGTFTFCSDATLYVPKGTLAKYEAAEGWNSFAQIVEMREPVEIKDINGDGAVDESDAQSVSDHLLGKEVTNFNADAADVNKDGAIDILDLVLIVDKLTGGQ